MSCSKSDYLEMAILNHLYRATPYTPPATVYVSLHTTVPTDSSNGVEVSGGSYARVAVTNNGTNWSAAALRVKTNATVIKFPTATLSWGTIKGWGTYDAPSGGNLLYYGNTSSVAINNGWVAQFAVGGLKIEESGSRANVFGNAILDLVYGATAYSPPATLYVALIAEFGGEVAGGNYARASIGTASSDWTVGASSLTSAASVTFPTSDGNWNSGGSGYLVDINLYDALSGGNRFATATGAGFASFTDIPANGKTLAFPIGGLSVLEL